MVIWFYLEYLFKVIRSLVRVVGLMMKRDWLGWILLGDLLLFGELGWEEGRLREVLWIFLSVVMVFVIIC